jgi:MFS family permease
MAGNLGIAFGPLVTASLLIVFDWRVVSALLVAPAVLAVAYALTAEFDEMAAVDVGGNDVDDGGGDPDGDGTAGDDGTADDDRSGGPDSLAGFLADSRALFTLGFALAMAVVLMNGVFYRGVLTFLPDVLGGYLPDVSGIGLFAPDSAMAREFDLASYLYAGLLTVGIAGQYVGGKLTDRIPVSAGLAAVFGALVVLAAAFIPVAEAGLWPLVAISAVFGFVLFSIQPLYQAAIAVYSPPDGRGLSYGYTYLANFGIGAAGAALAGYLLGVTTVRGTFLLLALVPAAGAVVALVLYSVVDAE